MFTKKLIPVWVGLILLSGMFLMGQEADWCTGQEGPPEDPTCSDGVDNDCDGLIDTEDPECNSAGNTLELGVNETHSADFRERCGPGVIKWCRIFIPGTSQPSFPIPAVTNAANRGEKVIISFKTSYNWQQVANHAADAWLTSLANYLAGLPTAGIIVYYHEPENDTNTTTNTPATWRAAMTNIMNVMGPTVRPAGWQFWNCLSEWTYDSRSTYPGLGTPRNPEDWWVRGLDGIGHDVYNWRKAQNCWADPAAPDISPEGLFRPDDVIYRRADLRTYTAGHGVPYGLMEFGCAVEFPGDPPAVAKRTAWLNAVADWLIAHPDPNLKFICYFEMNCGESGVEHHWRIANIGGTPGDEPASTTAFARFDDAG